ncbi:unnamed protein product [Orchesella dallaii]|uniref:Uncharacterized protein n=1 Tax=Orchesella dallaii TaxID=48710 RepID=A0ABP1R2G5_9HEXA
MVINEQMTCHKVTPSTSSTCSNIEIVKVRAPIIKQPQTSHNKVETQEDAASSGSCKKLEELYKLGFKSTPNICNTEVVKVHTSIIKQVQTQEDRLVGKNSPFINKNRMETYENKVSSGSCKTLEELHKMDLYDKPGKIFEIVKTEDLRTIKNALKSVEKEMNLSKLFDVKLKSLLHVAIEYQDYSVVKFLAKRYVFSDLFSQDSFKKSLVRLCMNDMHKLLPAKLEQKCKILNLLFKLQPELVNTRDEHGWTPLHLATMHAYRNNQLQYDLVNMLLRKNASINMQDNHNSTPLHMAVSFQVPDSSIIKLLIANGANPDVKFFQLLIDNGNPEVFHEVVVHLVSLGKDNLLTGHVAIGDTETVLSYAVLKFDVLKHTLKIFKSLGFNFKNYRLKSLLHVAIKGGRQGPFLKTLIKLGVEYKLTCLLHYCVQHSNLSALKIFISLGCDLNEKDCNRSTPLQIARSKNLQEIVKELVKHGSSM